MIQNKTFVGEYNDDAEDKLNRFLKDNQHIKILNSSYHISLKGADSIWILYDDAPKQENSDAFLYKDDFLFRVLMATYNENKEYMDHDPLKMSYEDLKKLRWHISRQCPNFKPEHHTCSTARCDKECGFFSSCQQELDNRIKEYYTGGHPDDTE